MAYASENLALISPGAGKENTRCFTYKTTDAVAVLVAAAYIEDGVDRGMRVGDLVDIVKVDNLATPTTFEHSRFVVTAVNAAGAATIAVSAPIT